MKSVAIVSVYSDEIEADAELSQAIKHFCLQAETIDRGSWRVAFESELHGLAFSKATQGHSITIRRERQVDAKGWEDWKDAGLGHIEPTGSLLPSSNPAADGNIVWRFADAWMWDETATPADGTLLRRLGVASVQGKGAWVWKAIKLGWRLTDTLDVRDDIAIWIAGQVAKKINREIVEYRAYMTRFEAEQRLVLEVAAERHARLNSGLASERRKWAQHYALIDKLNELGIS